MVGKLLPANCYRFEVLVFLLLLHVLPTEQLSGTITMPYRRDALEKMVVYLYSSKIDCTG